MFKTFMTVISLLLTSVKWREFQRNQIINSSVNVLKMVFHFSYGANVNLTSNIIILHR